VKSLAASADSGHRLNRPFVAVYPDQVQALGSIEAAAVLGHLAYLTSQDPAGVVATTGDLAAGTGLSPRTVQRVTTRLREAGVVTAERSSSWDPTLRWSVVQDHPIVAGHPVNATLASTWVRDQGVSLDAKVAVTPSHLEGLEDSPYSPPTDEQGSLPLLTVVPTADEDVDHFARFWDLWPSGRKVGKPKAQQAFTKALRRAPVEAIAAGLLAHLPSWQARIAAGEAGFVPHPTTWLNRDGWGDVPPPLPTAGRPRNALLDPHLMDGLPSLAALAAGGDR
jgi:DNA-binding transcriptional ArsR family regulator